MTTNSHASLFAAPKFRHLLALVGVIWLCLMVMISATIVFGRSLTLTVDPILTPVFYIVLFGSCSLWVAQRYRHRQIDLHKIIGPWPRHYPWQKIVGLWGFLFMFSLGAFQVSSVLLSYFLPTYVTRSLQEALFLNADQTINPWLYNSLMFVVLVIAAPIFEEFLFRGFLLHRWGTRWNTVVGLVLSSLLFGILHGNVIGLTMFGLVLGLLYLRTASLGIVIAIHAANNAIAASLDLLLGLSERTEPQTLEQFRANVWFGMILLAISLPFLIKFITRNWPDRQTPLPYFVNSDRAESSVNP